MAMSHAACDHDRTPKARAACRKNQRQHDSSTASLSETAILGWGPIQARVIDSPPLKVMSKASDGEDTPVTSNLIQRVQSKVNRRAKRTDPALKVGNRPLVPSADGVDYSHCVQAELHRGGGRCACGWHA